MEKVARDRQIIRRVLQQFVDLVSASGTRCIRAPNPNRPSAVLTISSR